MTDWVIDTVTGCIVRAFKSRRSRCTPDVWAPCAKLNPTATPVLDWFRSRCAVCLERATVGKSSDADVIDLPVDSDDSVRTVTVVS